MVTGNPLQYPCLETHRRSLVGYSHGVTKSQTRLSDFTSILHGDWWSDPEWTSFDWTPRGTGALVPAVNPCVHPPLGEWRRIWVSISCSRISHIGWDSELYLAVKQVTCPPPSRKDTGKFGWKIPRNSHPGKSSWLGAGLKMPGNYPPSGKVLGMWGSIGGKNRGILGAWLKDAEVTPL